VAEDIRRVSWFHSLPPGAQAAVAVGVISIIAQGVLVLCAYFLGKAQAKAQVRHQKAVEALVEALRTITKLQSEFGIWALYEKRSDLEIEHAREISRLLANLQGIIYDNSPWFEPATERKVHPVLNEALRYYSEHTDALKSDDATRIADSRKQLSKWEDEVLVLKVVALEDEARRLIGTKRSRRLVGERPRQETLPRTSEPSWKEGKDELP
jgi:hypothetical protein